MEKTSLALPATTITFLPVYVAEDKGIWKDLGLDVALHQITGMGATNAMLAGSVDFAVQSGPSLIRGNIRGRHMLGISLMADGVAFEIVARKQSFAGLRSKAPLAKRMAALKGKKVSVDSPNTVVDALLRYFAAKAGLNAKTRHDGSLHAADRGDRGAGSPARSTRPCSISRGPRPRSARARSYSPAACTDVPELLPTIATTTTTRAGFCDSHASICDKLVHGYVLAHKFIHEHPDEALQIALKRMPKANLSDLKKSMPLILKTTPQVPRYDEAAFKHAQQLMVFGGMLKQGRSAQFVRQVCSPTNTSTCSPSRTCKASHRMALRGSLSAQGHRHSPPYSIDRLGRE